MPKFRHLRLATLIGLLSFALPAPTMLAASPPTTCTAQLNIFQTTSGTVTTAGQVTHARGSGVGGSYVGGFLSGYTINGAQDIMVNNNTRTSQLQGQFTASGPGGTLVIRYTGHADLNTGAATGHFHTAGGTGQFANFHWQGDITAQLIGANPPTFLATDTGPCRTSP